MKQVSAANKNINCLENYQFRILSQFPEAPHELSVHKSSSTVLQNTATGSLQRAAAGRVNEGLKENGRKIM